MTAAEADALRDIQAYAAADRIRYTRHARERMFSRNVRRRDVRQAIRTATGCIASDRAWQVTGVDLDRDALTVVCAIEDGLKVITVY